MKKMSSKEIDEIIENVKASLAVENIKVDNISVITGKKYLNGEISSKEAIDSITEYIRNKQLRQWIFLLNMGQDLYYFAGKLREEDIIKGNTHFAKYQYIETSAIKLFEELKEENYLIGTSFNQFSEKASYYMAELNIIHPFREGNGRTIREFIKILALKNGYQIKWNSINQKTLFKASVESVLNLDPLIKCIKGAIKSWFLNFWAVYSALFLCFKKLTIQVL